MHRLLKTACLAAALAAAACSATTGVGDRLTLTGTVVLKGNEPATVPVLVRTPSEQWELQDLPAQTARGLQNRQVTVTGVVRRAPGAGFRLPALGEVRLVTQP